MEDAVESLSDVIEAVHRCRDPRADARLIARIMSSARRRRDCPCQLPRDAVDMMDEIIFSVRGYRPAYGKSHGTTTWARWWLTRLYASRETAR